MEMISTYSSHEISRCCTRSTNRRALLHPQLLVLSNSKSFQEIKNKPQMYTSIRCYITTILCSIMLLTFGSDPTTTNALAFTTISSTRHRQLQQYRTNSPILYKLRQQQQLSLLYSQTENVSNDNTPTSNNDSTQTTPNDTGIVNGGKQETTSFLIDLNGDSNTDLFRQQISTSSFGQSVSIRQRPTTSDSSTLITSDVITSSLDNKVNNTTPEKCLVTEERNVAAEMKKRNVGVAIVSIVLALSSYLYQYFNPIQPIQLLVEMQSKSPPLTVIGTNGKPSIVDFWAPWCENCKLMAPTLYSLEEEYHDKVNFIAIDGDNPAVFDLLATFRVDAIPHIAIVTPDGDVETALIGPIPRSVLKSDIETLLKNQIQPPNQQVELPYKMYDAFENEPSRRIRFIQEQE